MNILRTLTKHNVFKLLLLLILGCVIGYFSGTYYFFNIDREINLIDSLSLIVSTVVGLYIATSLNQSITVQKAEKDLVINEINQIKTDLAIIHNWVAQNNIPFDEAVFKFKILSKNITDLETLFDICHIKNNNIIKPLRDKTVAIKRLITKPSLVSGTNFIQLNLTDQNKFFSLNSEIKIIVIKLVIHINKN